MTTSNIDRLSPSFAAPKAFNYLYVIAGAAIFAGFALSIVSWMRICSQACSEGHNYRLFGFTFEAVGLTFFPILAITHLLSLKFPALKTIVGWMLCGALGSEVMFIYVQKYKIGAWCPVCLAIAASLAVAFGTYLYHFCRNFKITVEKEEKGKMMNSIFKGISGITFFAVGFILAFSGIGKFNQLQAAENTVKERIVFGNTNSPIEVYIFTDWACPACKSLDPLFESMAPAIMQKAKLTFVDEAVHPETLNFTPYNLSFMINNKSKYFELRHALTKLSDETKTPTDEQVEKMAASLGTRYQQLNYADVALGIKYFKHLVKQLEVEGTPTMVIINTETKKGKRLAGKGQITESGVMNAINAMLKQPTGE